MRRAGDGRGAVSVAYACAFWPMAFSARCATTIRTRRMIRGSGCGPRLRLLGLVVVIGLMPMTLPAWLVDAAAGAVTGAPVHEIALWHGLRRRAVDVAGGDWRRRDAAGRLSPPCARLGCGAPARGKARCSMRIAAARGAARARDRGCTTARFARLGGGGRWRLLAAALGLCRRQPCARHPRDDCRCAGRRCRLWAVLMVAALAASACTATGSGA